MCICLKKKKKQQLYFVSRDKFYSAAETLYVMAEEKSVLEKSTSPFMCIELSYQIHVDTLSYNVYTSFNEI